MALSYCTSTFTTLTTLKTQCDAYSILDAAGLAKSTAVDICATHATTLCKVGRGRAGDGMLKAVLASLSRLAVITMLVAPQQLPHPSPCPLQPASPYYGGYYGPAVNASSPDCSLCTSFLLAYKVRVLAWGGS